VDFGGKTKVGKTRTVKVTIKNTSSKSSKISVMLTGESASSTPPFGVTTQCVRTLAPGKSCKVSVTFTPTDTSPQAGNLTIMDSAQGNPQTVPLSGIAK
jgi:Abnormal spindle-like microcephaly-assoc'd, ASPM-SPD-2-Hydin/CARDB